MTSIQTRTAAAGLIALMALGSVVMWVGLPLGLLYLASHLQKGANPTLAPYLLILIGLPITMVIVGKALAALDRLFSRVTGHNPNSRPVQLPWHRSLRGERDSGRKRTVLDVVMIVSVTLAVVAFGIWFFVFAHASAPIS
jgi:hypothetical protein